MALLATVSGMSSFSLTIVVPALPSMAVDYGTDFADIQLLVSAYLLGLAISQPLWGHIADTIGRRPVALIGLALFIASSFACLLDPDLHTLAFLRVLQAVGSSSGAVAARAIIRDTHSAQEGASAMSWLSVGLGTAPIIAPIIGGGLLLWGDTQSIFAVMGVTGAVLWLLMYWEMHETLPDDAQKPAWGSLLGSFSTLLQSRGFLGYTAVYGFFQGGFFAFLAIGAAVFQDSWQLGPAAFGAIWGFMGIAYVIGAVVGGKLSTGPRRPLLLPVCVLSAFFFSALICVFDLLLGARMLTVLLPMFIMMAATGAAAPLVMAGAIYQVPHLAGTASGLSSALAMALAGSFTVAAGMVYRGDFTPIAALMATAAALTTISWLAIRRM